MLPHICSDLFLKQEEFHKWKIPAGKNTTWALLSEMPFLTLRLDAYWGALSPPLVALGEKLRAGDMCQTAQKFRFQPYGCSYENAAGQNITSGLQMARQNCFTSIA